MQSHPGNRASDPDSTSCLASLHSQPPAVAGTDGRPGGNLTQSLAGSSGTSCMRPLSWAPADFPHSHRAQARPQHRASTTSRPSPIPISQKDRQRPIVKLNYGRLAPIFTWPSTFCFQIFRKSHGVRNRSCMVSKGGELLLGVSLQAPRNMKSTVPASVMPTGRPQMRCGCVWSYRYSGSS